MVNGTGEFLARLNSLAAETGISLGFQLVVSSLTQVATAIQSGHYCRFLPDFSKSIVAENANLYSMKGLQKIAINRWNSLSNG